MEILIYGTINSVSLALMGLGFAMVYGISRVPNFAHGLCTSSAGSSPGPCSRNWDCLTAWPLCFHWPPTGFWVFSCTAWY